MRQLLFAAACAACAAFVAAPAAACCPAFPATAQVHIADQEVLIAYDPETKREHFVRKAAFKTGEKGFGFLVPTPGMPELAEAPDAVFDRLREALEPRIVRSTRWVPIPALSLWFLKQRVDGAFTKSAAAPRGFVNVLGRRRVAGYDAAILEASDADALTRWLKENGYDAREALTEWAEPYVEQGWKVTAFKYAADAAEGDVGTKAVRISFDTDRPLFPYRVPTDQLAPPGEGNTLRLFYVGPERASGALGVDRAGAWAGKTKLAESREDFAELLEGAVPAADVPAEAWLTAFEDETWPGGTEDLYFAPAEEDEELIPTRTIYKDVEFPLPLDVLAVLGVIVFVVRRRGRGKQDAD